MANCRQKNKKKKNSILPEVGGSPLQSEGGYAWAGPKRPEPGKSQARGVHFLPKEKYPGNLKNFAVQICTSAKFFTEVK